MDNQSITMAMILFGGGISMGATLVAWVVARSFERRAVARYKAREAEAQQASEQRWAEVATRVVGALGPMLVQMQRGRRAEPRHGGRSAPSGWETPPPWSDEPPPWNDEPPPWHDEPPPPWGDGPTGRTAEPAEES